jgi:hypothetical protein
LLREARKFFIDKSFIKKSTLRLGEGWEPGDTSRRVHADGVGTAEAGVFAAD